MSKQAKENTDNCKIRQKSEVYYLLDPSLPSQGGLKPQGPILLSNNQEAGETIGISQCKAQFETILVL